MTPFIIIKFSKFRTSSKKLLLNKLQVFLKIKAKKIRQRKLLNLLRAIKSER
jgi:hypothetical protein